MSRVVRAVVSAVDPIKGVSAGESVVFIEVPEDCDPRAVLVQVQSHAVFAPVAAKPEKSTGTTRGWRVGKDMGPNFRIYSLGTGQRGYTHKRKEAHVFTSRDAALREAADHWTNGRLYPVVTRPTRRAGGGA